MDIKLLIFPFMRETPTRSIPTWLLPIVSAFRNCLSFQVEAMSILENNIGGYSVTNMKGNAPPSVMHKDFEKFRK